MTSLQEAIHSKHVVTGYTHDFYRYPGRFSPSFARAIIGRFSQPGDLILDPLMGSGTTLVEARAAGRHSIGTDISSLAVFLARVKSTVWSSAERDRIRTWSKSVVARLNLRRGSETPTEETRSYYQRNINGRSTWPIRKTVELALNQIELLDTKRQRMFARCLVLRTAQWALDCRTEIPKASEVRNEFVRSVEEMLAGAKSYGAAVRHVERRFGRTSVQCLQRSVIGLETDPLLSTVEPPKLVLTSPPYPGVHVLYHRWQVLGRRETPAPFWIAGSQDGQGASFYTFGDRQEQELAGYFQRAQRAFRSIAAIAGPRTMIVQMLAFSEPMWQLPQYLAVMKRAGLAEIKFGDLATSADGRPWRTVPNRKWYATQRGGTAASSEVVLFHRPA